MAELELEAHVAILVLPGGRTDMDVVVGLVEAPVEEIETVTRQVPILPIVKAEPERIKPDEVGPDARLEDQLVGLDDIPPNVGGVEIDVKTGLEQLIFLFLKLDFLVLCGRILRRDSGTGERNGANGRRDNCHQPVHRFPFITWVNPSTTHYLSPHGAKRRIVYQNLAHKGAGKFDIISEYG